MENTIDKYTVKDGQTVLFFFQKIIDKDAKLIGSLGRGKSSNHDIDIHVPNLERAMRRCHKIKQLLNAESYEYTDWGGAYYKNTFFGDIDVFFKGSTDEFDY